MKERADEEKTAGVVPTEPATRPASNKFTEEKSTEHATEKVSTSESDEDKDSNADDKKEKEESGSLKDYVVSLASSNHRVKIMLTPR